MSELAKNEIKAARAVAGQIRDGIHNYLHTLALIGKAFQERHWLILGYKSWLDYVDGEFGEERLKLPTEHRRKAVEELRLLGMSQRTIAGTIGVDRETVARDAREVAGNQPPEVVGNDGKTYPTPEPPARRDPELTGESAVATTGGPDVEEVGPREGDSPPTSSTADLIASDPDIQAADYMARFSAALARSGGWMQFDAERVAVTASPTTWAAIEAHAEVVAHTYERMRKARHTLRVVPGGAA